MARKIAEMKRKIKGMILMRSFGRLKDAPSGRRGMDGDPFSTRISILRMTLVVRYYSS